MTFPSNAVEKVLMALRIGQVDGNSLLEALAQSARRAWAVIGDEADGSLILGIALANDDQKSRKSALDAVDAALRGAFVPYGVDSVFLDDPADPLVAWLLEKTDPFYTRPAQ
jgi:hypothetical protein